MKTFKLQPVNKRMSVQSFLQRSLMMMAAIMAALVTFVACGDDDDKNPVEVESVTINQPAPGVELVAGGSSITLSVTIEPANATNKAVTWSSSDNTIATVSNSGVVTGLKPGTVTITATTKSGNKTADFTLTVKPDANAQPIELKSPITENTTLKDLGLDVDYFYAGNNYLIVENNATLTIEPGVTIQFNNTGRAGGLQIRAGATIKAIGTAPNRIQFIGSNNTKGSWNGIRVETNSDNRFAYCDFLNAGNQDRYDSGSGLLLKDANAGISQCKFTNGVGYGIILSGKSQITAFDNNVVEDYELSPVCSQGDNQLKVLEKFDMTSDLTNNKNPYIVLPNVYVLEENVTLNQTTVPYNFHGTGMLELRNCILTINEGITIYMSESKGINGSTGRLMVNGTTSKKVRFTRIPDGGAYYWRSISFDLPGSVIKNCIFEYGGNIALLGMISIGANANLTLENVEINNSDTYGVGLQNSGYVLQHTNVTFSNNRDGNVNKRFAPTGILSHFP